MDEPAPAAACPTSEGGQQWPPRCPETPAALMHARPAARDVHARAYRNKIPVAKPERQKGVYYCMVFSFSKGLILIIFVSVGLCDEQIRWSRSKDAFGTSWL